VERGWLRQTPARAAAGVVSFKTVSDDSDEQNRTTIHTRIYQAAVPAAARDEVAHYLVMIEGVDPGRRILLRPGTITVGRDGARDLVLADQDVSRLHARISVDDDRVVVEDTHSTNGTFVDGRAISGPVELVDGAGDVA